MSIPAADDEARHPAAAHSGPLHPDPTVRRDLLFWMRSWQKDAFAEYFRVARRDSEQIRARIAMLRRWAASGR